MAVGRSQGTAVYKVAFFDIKMLVILRQDNERWRSMQEGLGCQSLPMEGFRALATS